MKQVNAHNVNLKDKIFIDQKIYEIAMIRKNLLENKVTLGLKLLGSINEDLVRFIEREYPFMDKIEIIETY